jgi:hypothetical protein
LNYSHGGCRSARAAEVRGMLLEIEPLSIQETTTHYPNRRMTFVASNESLFPQERLNGDFKAVSKAKTVFSS